MFERNSYGKFKLDESREMRMGQLSSFDYWLLVSVKVENSETSFR